MVSIIVPIHRAEKYLHECINSVREQTYKDWELILVDDGSPDGCPNICDEYSDNDSRIRTIHKTMGGVSSARNCGLDNAKGEWILFVDADDMIVPNALEVLINMQAKYNADVVCFDASMIDANGKFVKHLKTSEPSVSDYLTFTIELFSNKHEYSIWSKLYRRSYIDSHRFINGLRLGEDVLFTTSLVYNRPGIFATIGDHLYLYRSNEDSYTHKPRKAVKKDAECYQQELRAFLNEALKDSNDALIPYFMKKKASCVHSILTYQGLIKNVTTEDLSLMKESFDYIPSDKTLLKRICRAYVLHNTTLASCYVTLVMLPIEIKGEILNFILKLKQKYFF